MNSTDEQFRDLTALFEPSSIAVIGASANPGSPGSRPLRLFDSLGSPGVAYAVNPGQPEVAGRRSYARVQDIGASVDLAVIQVQRELSLAAIDDAVAAGVRSICLLTAGYREFDEKGAVLEQEIKARVATAGIPLLGPNSLGWCDFQKRIVVSQTEMFELLDHVPGPVSVVTQSGAVGGAIWVQGMARGVGFNKFVSTGNESDLDSADVISYLAHDPSTKIIACYLEAVRNGPRFRRALEEAADADKPIVLLKVGVSDVGARAASSHTGAVAGSNTVFDAVLDGLPVFRADGPESMLDALHALQQSKSTTTLRGSVVVTNSGGYGVLLSDLASGAGIPMPQLDDRLADKILTIQPNATTTNPIDITGIPPRHRKSPYNIFAEVTEELVADDQFDTLLLNTYVTPQLPRWQEVFERVAQASEKTDKRLVVIGLTEPHMRRRMTAAGVMVFEQPRQAIDAIAAMNGIYRNLAARRVSDETSIASDRWVNVLKILGEARRSGQSILDEVDSKRALAAIGVTVVREAVVSSPENATAAAREIGFPVVLKGLVQGLAHKSDYGLVEIGLADDAELIDAYSAMLGAVDKVVGSDAYRRSSRIVVQEMVAGGVECIVGLENDETFGPVVIVGSGGVLTELVADHAVALCPINQHDADRLIRRTKVGQLLGGFRSQEGHGTGALVETIVALSQFAAANPDAVSSIDINPLKIVGGRRSAVAVDGLVVLSRPI